MVTPVTPETPFPRLTVLHDMFMVIDKVTEEWTKEWWEEGLKQGREEGLQEGLEQGRQEGLKEGLKQGQKKGEMLMLVHLLEHKFGPVSEQHLRRLEETDADTLLEWSERILQASGIDEVVQKPILELTELDELLAMFGERLGEWSRLWRNQGFKKGREEGLLEGMKQGRQVGLGESLQEGQRKGETLLLTRLLERKFGPLSDQQRSCLEEVDADTLLNWSERILTANSIDEVLPP